jgi:gelsolin
MKKEPIVFHVQKGKLVRVPDPGAFGKGDCYLVDAGLKVYLWIGPNSSVDEKFLTAAAAVMKDQARSGRADIDRIDGGNEPDEFKTLFDDFRLTDEDTAGILKRVQLEKHEYKLWRVHREGDETFFAEVPVDRDYLSSDDVYVLDTWDDIYVWRGTAASAREKFDATILARRYDAERVGTQDIELIEQGFEPEDFWKFFE